MSPNVKKFVSAIGVACVGAALAVVSHYVPQLPQVVQGLAMSALAAVAHYVDAWGHTDRVAAALAAAEKHE